MVEVLTRIYRLKGRDLRLSSLSLAVRFEGCYVWVSEYGVLRFLGFSTRSLGIRMFLMEKGYAHMVSICSCRGSSLFYRFMVISLLMSRFRYWIDIQVEVRCIHIWTGA